MSIVNIILDFNICLGLVSLCLNLFVLGVLIGRRGDNDD
jgi:hypothetical protein